MIECDAEKLTKAIMELEPKRRMQAMKGAFRKAANKVKKQAVGNLRQSGINTKTGLAKGIRSVVWKKKAGFRVTIGTKRANKQGKGERGFHYNRRERKKAPDEKKRGLPILIWAEEGTEKRYTKSRTKIFKRKKKGHYTGKMKPLGFMEKTRKEMEDKVTDELRQAMEESIMKALKKYGR